MEDKKGTIFDIQRFSLHDGPGIRTTVFFKGCPLRCLWCHNPESISFTQELSHYSTKCLGCGDCNAACPAGALTAEDGMGLKYNRDECRRCWKCTEVCPTGALRLQGQRYTVGELMDEVMEDLHFYRRSGGGVTLSGGEPTAQFEFLKDFLASLQGEGLHTALDTSGYVTWGRISSLLPLVDLLLYDIKHMDPKKHKELTGAGNKTILRNLKRADTYGQDIEVRIPVIPACNDSRVNLQAIADFIAGLEHVQSVVLLGYHELGKSKPYLFEARRESPDAVPMGSEELDEIREYMAQRLQGRKVTSR